eukprot:gene1231-715_t
MIIIYFKIVLFIVWFSLKFYSIFLFALTDARGFIICFLDLVNSLARYYINNLFRFTRFLSFILKYSTIYCLVLSEFLVYLLLVHKNFVLHKLPFIYLAEENDIYIVHFQQSCTSCILSSLSHLGTTTHIESSILFNQQLTKDFIVTPSLTGSTIYLNLSTDLRTTTTTNNNNNNNNNFSKFIFFIRGQGGGTYKNFLGDFYILEFHFTTHNTGDVPDRRIFSNYAAELLDSAVKHFFGFQVQGVMKCLKIRIMGKFFSFKLIFLVPRHSLKPGDHMTSLCDQTEDPDITVRVLLFLVLFQGKVFFIPFHARYWRCLSVDVLDFSSKPVVSHCTTTTTKKLARGLTVSTTNFYWINRNPIT